MAPPARRPQTWRECKSGAVAAATAPLSSFGPSPAVSEVVAQPHQRHPPDGRSAGEAPVVLIQEVLDGDLERDPLDRELVAQRQVEEGVRVDAGLGIR